MDEEPARTQTYNQPTILNPNQNTIKKGDSGANSEASPHKK